MSAILAIPNLAVRGIVMTTCCLSIIGSSLIIFSYFRWKDLQTTSRKLLVFLSIADLATAIGNLIGSVSEDTGAFCVAQSTLTTFSSMASFHWTVYIAVFLLLCIPGLSSNPDGVVPYFHVMAWGLPLVVVAIALGFGVLGPSAVGWCWIDDQMPQYQVIAWGLFTGKAWELIAYVATIVLYLVIRMKVRQFTRKPA